VVQQTLNFSSFKSRQPHRRVGPMCHPLPPHLIIPLSPPLLFPIPISDPLYPRRRPGPLPPRRPQALPSTAVSTQLTIAPRPAPASAAARRAPAGASSMAVALHGRCRQPRPPTTLSMTGMRARLAERSAVVVRGTGTTNVSDRRRLSACPVSMRGGW
jgi:hypothetical protein